MTPVKTIVSCIIILSFAVMVSAADAFLFSPQSHTAQIQTTQISFTDNATNEPAGPRLYLDETDSQFFALIKNMVQEAQSSNSAVNLRFENVTSPTHGQYQRIIPEF